MKFPNAWRLIIHGHEEPCVIDQAGLCTIPPRVKCAIHDDRDTAGKCSCSAIVKALRLLLIDADKLQRKEDVVSEALNVDGAFAAIRTILECLPDEETRKEVLARVLDKRCRKCFDYNPNGQFWCCYDSRGA